MRPASCDFHLEKELIRGGQFMLVAGVDEAGMGCLAGPVVAAAVILDPDHLPRGVNDSKKLTPKKREELDGTIRSMAKAYSIAWASVEEIDEINIYHAGRLAMKRAIEGLKLPPDFVLGDGNGKLNIAVPYKMVVGGDGISVSIGSASILAKVYRDRWMAEFDTLYPGYGFASHKGYATELHRESLQRLGETKIHRKSFHWQAV